MCRQNEARQDVRAASHIVAMLQGPSICSRNGPGSAAYAFHDFRENMFVDLVIESAPGETESLRYHVLRDKEGRWYFDPRPDLCPASYNGTQRRAEVHRDSV